MKVWLKEYSLRILTLHTADPQGKQNILCPDPRDWNAELVISCAIFVLMERWHQSMYFEARVIRVLDQAAITALQHWRFQPGKMEAINIPIAFRMNGSRARSRAIAPEGVL